MFGIGRRKTQGQLAKAELNQGIGHLRQAATHAAKGAGATVGPRVRAARGAVAPTAIIVRNRASRGVASALAPLVMAMRNAQAEAAGQTMKNVAKQTAMTKKAKAKNMKIARKKQKRSRGMMAGLLAAGTVAGLAGAMAMRRRREQLEWTEYDPAGKLEPTREGVDTIMVETPDSTAKVTQAGAGSSAAAGNGSASTARASSQPVIQPNDKVPSVAEAARDVSGRPANDITKALNTEKTAAKASNRR